MKRPNHAALVTESHVVEVIADQDRGGGNFFIMVQANIPTVEREGSWSWSAVGNVGSRVLIIPDPYMVEDLGLCYSCKCSRRTASKQNDIPRRCAVYHGMDRDLNAAADGRCNGNVTRVPSEGTVSQHPVRSGKWHDDEVGSIVTSTDEGLGCRIHPPKKYSYSKPWLSDDEDGMMMPERNNAVNPLRRPRFPPPR